MGNLNITYPDMDVVRHLEGSGVGTLRSAYLNAEMVLGKAIESMQMAYPHSRDYRDTDREQARAEHDARLKAVKQAYSEIRALRRHVYEGEIPKTENENNNG